MAAVAVQVAAAAALMTPASADPYWPGGDCPEGVALGTYVCTDTEIKWGPDNWTVIADGFVCTSSGWDHVGFWTEDTDDEGRVDALQNVLGDCQNGGQQ
jgi:hypothetical protein